MSMLNEAKQQLDAAYKYAAIDPESWERLHPPVLLWRVQKRCVRHGCCGRGWTWQFLKNLDE